MQLKKLILKNFKGITEFTINASGDIDVYGDNATGKTTLFDASTWLLFDKDSLGSAQFDIKSLDITGEAAHNLEHTVEGFFDLDGTELILKKTYVENWVQKRGTSHSTFSGHTTNHFIDDVPVQKKEYLEKIKQICDPDTFILLTNPRHFNEALHWEERRSVLLTVCGDVSNEEVVKLQPELADAIKALGKRDLEDQKKVDAARKQEINREMKKIPVRVDEITSSAVETRELGVVKANISLAEVRVKEINDDISTMETSGPVPALQDKLRDVEGKIAAKEGKASIARIKANTEREAQRSVLARSIVTQEEHITSLSSKLNDLLAFEDTRPGLEEEATALRDLWHDESGKIFHFNDDEITALCPSCGQKLPEAIVEATKARALELFNKAKAEKLTDINDEGRATKDQIASITKQIETNLEEGKTLNERLDSGNTLLEKLQKELKDFDNTGEVIPEDPELDDLKAQEEDLNTSIENGSKEIDTTELEEALRLENEKLIGFKTEELQIQANRRIVSRVEELQEQEKALSAEYEKIEQRTFQLEEFTKAKVKMLEEKINSNFSFVKWKLFESQINEGVKPCCIATVDGVPYGSMNSASRINVGLDICNTLGRYHSYTPFLWIDNAESVTELLETKAQQIRLHVSESDKALRVKKS